MRPKVDATAGRQSAVRGRTLIFVLMAAGCSPDQLPTADSRQDETLRAEQVPRRETTNGQLGYSARSDSLLWLDVRAGGGRAIVGLKKPQHNRGVFHGKLFLTRAEWQATAMQLGAIPGVRVVSVDTLLPRAVLQLSSVDAQRRLRNRSDVDYVEPDALPEMAPANWGCGETQNNLATISVPASGGYDAMSAMYPNMFIDRAWQYSDGSGVTIGLVDTGLYPSQVEMVYSFGSGLSIGRTLQMKDVGGNPNCTHGTRMAGLIAAPRNGSGTVGVAYRSNLAVASALSSVWTTEGIGSAASNVMAGIRWVASVGAKVTVMAFGQVTWHSGISDEIDFWHYNLDMLYVGAAGTCPDNPLNPLNTLCSVSATAFPARKSEVFSVSGTTWSGGIPSEVVIYATKVEAVVNIPLTTTGKSFPLVTFGGSSAATAVIGGVAGLVRSRYPMMTAQGVMNQLRHSVGPSCGTALTWHNALINAEAAVGGICPYGPSGPNIVVFDRSADDPRLSQTILYSVSVTGGNGPTEIRWGDYSTGTTHPVTFTRGNYMTEVFVDVRDSGQPGLPSRRLRLPVQVIDRDTDPNCPTCF